MIELFENVYQNGKLCVQNKISKKSKHLPALARDNEDLMTTVQWSVVDVVVKRKKNNVWLRLKLL